MLRPLFVALPMPRGTDAESLLALYFVALEGLPLQAVQSVVMKIVKGLWPEPVTYCPRPPELANMVRNEYAAMREPAPTVSALPVRRPFRDLCDVQRESARELAGQGYVRIAEGITHDTFRSLTRSRSWPTGAVHLWAIDEVWSPTAARVDTAAIEAARTKAAGIVHEPITSERAEDRARMLALPDAKNVSAEHMAYRRKREAELAAFEAGEKGQPDVEESSDHDDKEP